MEVQQCNAMVRKQPLLSEGSPEGSRQYLPDLQGTQTIYIFLYLPIQISYIFLYRYPIILFVWDSLYISSYIFLYPISSYLQGTLEADYIFLICRGGRLYLLPSFSVKAILYQNDSGETCFEMTVCIRVQGAFQSRSTSQGERKHLSIQNRFLVSWSKT